MVQDRAHQRPGVTTPRHILNGELPRELGDWLLATSAIPRAPGVVPTCSLSTGYPFYCGQLGPGATSESAQSQGNTPENEGATVEQEEQAPSARLLPRGGLGVGAPQSATRLASPTSNDPYFGPYKILSVDGHRITVRCSLRLGGTLVCAAQHLKRYYNPEDLCGGEWELDNEEIAALDLQGAASPMELEGNLPDMDAEEMAKEGFYLVKSILRHRYRQGWRFLTLREGFGVEEAPWEPFSAFVLPERRLNLVLVDFCPRTTLQSR